MPHHPPKNSEDKETLVKKELHKHGFTDPEGNIRSCFTVEKDLESGYYVLNRFSEAEALKRAPIEGQVFIDKQAEELQDCFKKQNQSSLEDTLSDLCAYPQHNSWLILPATYENNTKNFVNSHKLHSFKLLSGKNPVTRGKLSDFCAPNKLLNTASAIYFSDQERDQEHTGILKTEAEDSLQQQTGQGATEILFSISGKKPSKTGILPIARNTAANNSWRTERTAPATRATSIDNANNRNLYLAGAAICIATGFTTSALALIDYENKQNNNSGNMHDTSIHLGYFSACAGLLGIALGATYFCSMSGRRMWSRRQPETPIRPGIV